jgi:uncharacterized protein
MASGFPFPQDFTPPASRASAAAGGRPFVASPAALAQRRRAALLRWLRQVHGWLGLWGAVIGFLLGFTGIVLTHRAILKLPIDKGEQSVVQVRVAAPPVNAEALAAALSRELGFDGQPPRIRIEPARAVEWNSVGVQQPQRWELFFDHPSRRARVEYFVGNGFAKVEKYDATWIGTLTRLHMSTGVDAFWVLLMDTIAASFMVLALTGTLLWTQMRPARLATAAVLLGAPALAATWLAFSL